MAYLKKYITDLYYTINLIIALLLIFIFLLVKFLNEGKLGNFRIKITMNIISNR